MAKKYCFSVDTFCVICIECFNLHFRIFRVHSDHFVLGPHLRHAAWRLLFAIRPQRIQVLKLLPLRVLFLDSDNNTLAAVNMSILISCSCGAVFELSKRRLGVHLTMLCIVEREQGNYV